MHGIGSTVAMLEGQEGRVAPPRRHTLFSCATLRAPGNRGEQICSIYQEAAVGSPGQGLLLYIVFLYKGEKLSSALLGHAPHVVWPSCVLPFHRSRHLKILSTMLKRSEITSTVRAIVVPPDVTVICHCFLLTQLSWLILDPITLLLLFPLIYCPHSSSEARMPATLVLYHLYEVLEMWYKISDPFSAFCTYKVSFSSLWSQIKKEGRGTKHHGLTYISFLKH